MSKNQKTLQGMPNEASELLPWFLNGTLPPEEEAAVAKQLQLSPEVRAEFADLQDMAKAVHENRPKDWEPSAGHLSGIMARIDAETAPAAEPTTASRPSGVMEWFRNLGRGTRWVLGAQLACILVLAGVLFSGQMPARDDGTFRTLTSTGSGTIVERSIKVVFAPETTTEQIQELLASIDAKIIDGPSALGSFMIAIPDDMLIETARAALRESPFVVLVQIQQITTRD